MPELPEVHTTASILNKLVKNLNIIDIWTDYESAYYKGKDEIKNPEFFSYFRKTIKDTKILSVKRRAKNILIELDNDFTILIHMKMTGHLLYGTYKKIRSTKHDLSAQAGIRNKSKIKNKKENSTISWEVIEPKELKDPFNRFIHFVISLSNGKHIAFSDMRKFAKITLFPTKDTEKTKHLKDIGPEPLSENFSEKIFRSRLYLKPHGKIKTILMDQNIIAGIGNIYSDEILWASSVHPESIINKIPEKKINEIYKNMRSILTKGIDLGGDSMSDYRNPYGEKGNFQYHHKVYKCKGKKCVIKICKGIIERKVIAGRSSHFCPTHQILY